MKPKDENGNIETEQVTYSINDNDNGVSSYRYINTTRNKSDDDPYTMYTVDIQYSTTTKHALSTGSLTKSNADGYIHIDFK